MAATEVMVHPHMVLDTEATALDMGAMAHPHTVLAAATATDATVHPHAALDTVTVAILAILAILVTTPPWPEATTLDTDAAHATPVTCSATAAKR